MKSSFSFLIFSVTLIFCLFSCDKESGKSHYLKGLQHFEMASDDNQSEKNEAEKEFKEAISKGFVERDVFLKLYYCYPLSKRFNKKRIKVLSDALKVYPNDIQFYDFRGSNYRKNRNFKKALKDFNKAISLDSLKKYEYINGTFYERGAINYYLGDTISSISDFKTSQDLSDYELREYKDFIKTF